MKYEAVYLHTREGEFVGAAIKKAGTLKLYDTNIWSESQSDVEDFRATLTRLNDENVIRQFWPEAMDPEVVELVEDPEWEKLELHNERVPNWAKSTLVYKKDSVWGYEYDGATDSVQPRPGPEGQPEWKDSQELDDEATTIVYENRMVPDPQEVQNRYFKAQETVARRRALAASA